ncbi:MAG: hypothetical protein OHK0023_01790 [Anaerolineae bacterium]
MKTLIVNRENQVALLLGILWAYLTAIGGTWAGFAPEIARYSLIAVVVCAMLWLALHGSLGRQWQYTALDIPIVLWCLVFAVNALGNWEKIGWIGYGLWFAALYIVVYFTLSAIIGFIGKERAMIVFLVSGLPVLFSAMASFGNSTGRLQGWLQNANLVGSFVGLWLPLVLGYRAFCVKSKPQQRGLLFLAAIMIGAIALFGSISRGAMIGLMIALLFSFIVSRERQYVIMMTIVLVVFCLLTTTVTRTGYPAAGDRKIGDTDRLRVYGHALNTFAEHPIIGNGLFTYRCCAFDAGDVSAYYHAHNATLHIAAELGIFGLAALGATVIAVIYWAIQAWRRDATPMRPLRLGSLMALIACAVHQFVDFTVMTPALALGLIWCIILATDTPSLTARRGRHQMAQSVVLLITWVLLLGVALYSLAKAPNGLTQLLVLPQP